MKLTTIFQAPSPRKTSTDTMTCVSMGLRSKAITDGLKGSSLPSFALPLLVAPLPAIGRIDLALLTGYFALVTLVVLGVALVCRVRLVARIRSLEDQVMHLESRLRDPYHPVRPRPHTATPRYDTGQSLVTGPPARAR